MFYYITKGLYLEKSKREVIWDRRSMLALGESNKNKAPPHSLSLFSFGNKNDTILSKTRSNYISIILKTSYTIESITNDRNLSK
jgi:hypothetical protein